MGQEAPSSSKQNVALTCDEHKKIKKNNKIESSSSKRQEKYADGDGDEEEMMVKMKLPHLPPSMKKVRELINRVKNMINVCKIMSTGMPIIIEDIIFTSQRRRQRKKGCFCCSEIGNIMEDCPNKPKPKDKKKGRREKVQSHTTIKTWDDT